jgi:DNA-binding response OmpR family regulator
MFAANLLFDSSKDQTQLRSRIVIVEDEPDLRDAVAEYLAANGYDVTTASDAAEMREIAARQPFDLAILDIAMPGEDGLSLGRWLRANFPAGLIFSSAAGASIDRVVGLELGADDYLVKPYELRELLARVRSVLRRVQVQIERIEPAARAAPERRVLAFGPYQVDLDARRMTKAGGGTVDMSKSEFDVLEIFLTRANRLLTRATISEAIGISDDSEASRALDIRIMRLRKKIEDDPSDPKFLRTVRGEGYIFSLPAGAG